MLYHQFIFRVRMANKSKQTIEIEQALLKLQLKDEIMDELDDVIRDRIKEIAGPTVLMIIGDILDFPLSVLQIAKLMGKTESGVYKMCQRGKLPHKRVGSKIYINLKDINQQLLEIHVPD